MNNYNDFAIKALLEDAKFQKWVYNKESDLFWQEFIKKNPEKLENIEQAKSILLSIRGDLDLVTPQ